MTVHYVLITTQMPRHGDLGRTEEAWYVIDTDHDGVQVVTLTDPDGLPISKGRLQEYWTAKVKKDEEPQAAASRLLHQKIRADKSKSDFNRTLHYPKSRVPC